MPPASSWVAMEAPLLQSSTGPSWWHHCQLAKLSNRGLMFAGDTSPESVRAKLLGPNSAFCCHEHELPAKGQRWMLT